MDLFASAPTYPPEQLPAESPPSSSGAAAAWPDATDGAGNEMPRGDPAPAASIRSIGEELRSLAVDELTPRLALERIYQWRAMLEDDGRG